MGVAAYEFFINLFIFLGKDTDGGKEVYWVSIRDSSNSGGMKFKYLKPLSNLKASAMLLVYFERSLTYWSRLSNFLSSFLSRMLEWVNLLAGPNLGKDKD
jgi:hypothetical protein